MQIVKHEAEQGTAAPPVQMPFEEGCSDEPEKWYGHFPPDVRLSEEEPEAKSFLTGKKKNILLCN